MYRLTFKCFYATVQEIGYSRKKPKKEVEDSYGEFSKYQRNSMWNFLGLIKNEVEFTGVTKKKLCRISKGLGFWTWNFQGM